MSVHRYRVVRSVRNRLLLWLIITFGASLGGGASGDVNTWTSASGQEVQAAFVRMEMDLVVLRTEDGQDISIHLNMLSPEDQVRARNFAAASPPAGREADEDDEDDDEGGGLPVLQGGPGRGHYAYFQHRNYDAYITSSGRFFVQPKVNGQPSGRPIAFARITLRQQATTVFRAQRVAEFRDVSPPALNPRSLSYTVVTDTSEQVQFKVDIAFDGSTLCISAEIIEPRRPSIPSKVRITSHFPATYGIPPTMPQEERKRVLADASMEVRRRAARNLSYTFYDALSIREAMDELRVKGPWGPLTMRITSDNRRDGNRTQLRNYSGEALHSGYEIRRFIYAEARSGTYCITFE